MTLSRQLYTLVLIISFLTGIGTLFISIENTRSYLMLQLATQTQDAANALGLSLVPYMKDHDIAAMDTMVNAVFDSGYYKSLSLQSMSGESLIERENTSQIEGVPHWFINLLTLETAKVNSIITTGWTQSGRLTLETHPGFAYIKLWKASEEILWWSLLVFMLSLAVAFLILRTILKPLDAVEKQALDICNREFPVVKNIPKTRELKRVVLAMNKMSAKVEAILAKLTERAEQMHKQVDYDELTGLMNRKRFIVIANTMIRDKEKVGDGYIAIIRFSNLASYNKQFGYTAGDELVKKTAQLLSQLCETFPESIPARIGSVDFAAIMPHVDAASAASFGLSLSNSLKTLGAELALDNIAYIGMAYFAHNSTFGEILADADVALASAQHQGMEGYHIQNKKSEVMGNMAWKKLIQDVLEQENIHFVIQAVMTSERKSLFSEVLIRIKGASGQNISPASFVAMAERMGLHDQLDQYAIRHITHFLEQNPAWAIPLAVKISASSITTASFSSWLQQHLENHPQAASLLYFEMTEYGALQDIEAARHFIDLVHPHHGKVVMEHFGTRPSSFQTLRQLKVDFIKLDGSYVRDISTNNEHHAFLQAVVDIAQGLDIQVIIEHVETAEDVRHFTALGINAMQGYFFGKPESMD